MKKLLATLLALVLVTSTAQSQDSTIYVSLGTAQPAGSIYVEGGYGWQHKWLIPVNVANPSARDFSAFGTTSPDPLGRTIANLRTTGNLRVIYGQGATPGYEDPTVHGTFWPIWMVAAVQEMWPTPSDSEHMISFAGWYHHNDPCGFNPTEGWMMSFPVWGDYGTVELIQSGSKAHDCPNIISLPVAVSGVSIVPPPDVPPVGGGGEGGGCCQEGAATIEAEGRPKEVRASEKRTTWAKIKSYYR